LNIGGALRPLWKTSSDCEEELNASTGKDLLSTISAIEKLLKQQNFFSAVTEP
jgi:hypothetical protein